jgi:hypothetical protein
VFVLEQVASSRPNDCSSAASVQEFRLLILDQSEALTRDLLQPVGVENCDMSVSIPYQTSLLKRTGRHGHSRTAEGQHHRQKLLREWQIIGANPMARQQQPSRAALVHGMRAIAGGGLRDLLVKALDG